jgi:hypothetical protein
MISPLTLYSQIQPYDGSQVGIEQTITVCPKTKYTIFAWAISTSKKDKCWLTVCEPTANKCSRSATITTNGNSVSTNFKSGNSQTSATLQVYIDCHGQDATHVNTLFVDKIEFSKAA